MKYKARFSMYKNGKYIGTEDIIVDSRNEEVACNYANKEAEYKLYASGKCDNYKMVDFYEINKI